MPCNEPKFSKWSPAEDLYARISIQLTRPSLRSWLHSRPPQDVYRILIDTYQLRMDDMFVIAEQAEENSMYNGKQTGYFGFRRFLEKAKAATVLPPWWNEDIERECQKQGLPAHGLPMYKLSDKVSEAAIKKRYGDATFATQLRLFAAGVYGSYLEGLPTVLRKTAYTECVINRFMFPRS